MPSLTLLASDVPRVCGAPPGGLALSQLSISPVPAQAALVDPGASLGLWHRALGAPGHCAERKAARWVSFPFSCGSVFPTPERAVLRAPSSRGPALSPPAPPVPSLPAEHCQLSGRCRPARSTRTASRASPSCLLGHPAKPALGGERSAWWGGRRERERG